jgi:hypothetical protein
VCAKTHVVVRFTKQCCQATAAMPEAFLVSASDWGVSMLAVSAVPSQSQMCDRAANLTQSGKEQLRGMQEPRCVVVSVRIATRRNK